MNSSKYALVLAIVLGVLAAFGVQQHMSSLEKRKDAEVKPVRVVFAKENIQEGEEIRQVVLETRDWPQLYVFDQLYYESDLDQLNGKIASSSIPQGTPLLKRLVEPKQGPAPSSGIPNGKRAFTLPIDAINGVAGMIKPGNTVDILAHLKDVSAQPARRGGGGGQTTATVAVLENVSILGVGPQAGRRWGGRRDAPADLSSVTVAVTPEQATLLLHVLKEGSICLMLRRDGEFAPATPPVVDSGNLMATIERLRQGGSR